MRDLDDPADEPTGATKREGRGSPRPPRPPIERLARGTPIGRYLVIDVLGVGGMGVVYAAFDPELDRKVAIKLLQATPAGGAGGDQAWLLREAQAMARLSHPNVIAVHDVGTLPGDRVFVAMEHVDGTTLRLWLKGQRRPWREVLPVMLAAGAGLAAAHAGGLVHRDFKPDNVLVGKDGRVRVLDFGLARLHTDADGEAPAARTSDLQLAVEAAGAVSRLGAGDRHEHDPAPSAGVSAGRASSRRLATPDGERAGDSPLKSWRSPLAESLTTAGTVLGTPEYMAPELYRGAAADARSDQFSFGVALYEALFRARPFAKHAPRVEPAPPPPNDVPARLARVVMRAIAVDRDARFPNMDELLAALAIDVAGRRRRGLIAAGMVVGLGVAVAGGSALSSAPAASRGQLCTGAERRLAGIWDDATRAAVRTSFAAIEKPFAAPAFAGLERALDRYAGEWQAAAVESCEATRLRGEQTEEVLSLRQACLDQRRGELGALTHLLAHADEELVVRGDKVVFGLEPVARCADVAALRAPGRPPTEPKQQLDRIHAALATSKAALLAGHYAPSVEAAKEAAAIAVALAYPPYRAEALLVQGASLAGVGDNAGAAAAFAEAVYAALASNRHDVAAGAAQAAAILATQRKLGEAQIWSGLARAAIAHVPHDGVLEQRQRAVEGLVAAASGDLTGAIAALEQALVAAQRRFGADSPALWTEEDAIAVAYAKAGAYDKARPHYERALALREQSVGPDHPDLALLLTNLGPCYSHAGRRDQARAAYERALAIHERIAGAKNPLLILTLNNMADGLIKAGDPAGALVAIDRARQSAETLLGRKNLLYQLAATTRAEALAAAGRHDDARAQYDEAIAIETETQSPLLGPTLGSRATMAVAEARWSEAVFFARRAIAAIEAAGGDDTPDLLPALTSLGRAHLELGRPAAARPLLERAIVIGEQAQVSAADLAPARALLARTR